MVQGEDVLDTILSGWVYEAMISKSGQRRVKEKIDAKPGMK